MESQTIGRRIQQARERAGLTQAQLAAEVGIDRSCLTKVEGGTRRVSALELAGIATALEERIEWFVPDPPASIISHRNQQEPGSRCPRIERVIERVARAVEFVQEQDVTWSLTNFEPLSRPQTVAEAENRAREVRQRLGLQPCEPVKDLVNTFVDLGLLTFTIDLGPDAVNAGSVLLSRGGIAVVNADRKVGLRRLALAHELGHHVFADEYTTDHRIGQTDDTDTWEHRLDRFARALLAPREGVQAAWTRSRGQGKDLRTTVIRMASEFMTDMSTLAPRLSELRLIDREQAALVRAVRTGRADILDLELVVRDELAPGPASLPLGYQQAILRLYRQESVSAARAIDLLPDTWEGQLPELADLPRNAIWEFVSGPS